MSLARPNILLIVTDCARSDRWLGAGRATKTPNLDRLAGEGLALPTTITEKACTTPSFSTLLTGLYSPRHGVHLVWGYRLPTQVRMLTDVLATHGYHTYAEVTGPLLPEMGLDRGFESYSYRAPCDGLHTAWGDQFVERLRTGHYRGPWFIMLHLWELHPDRRVAAEFDTPEFGESEYDRAVSSLDAQLGRVLSAVGDNTLTIFTGDHGEKTSAETYREGTAVDYSRKLLGVDEADGMAPFAVAGWAGPSVLNQLYGQCTPMMRKVRLRDAKPSRNFGLWSRMRDRARLLRLTPMIFLQDLLALGTPLKLTRMLEKRGLLDPNRAKKKVERFSKSMNQDQLLDMHMRMWINSYKRNIDEGHVIHVYDFLVKVPLVFHWPGRITAGATIDRMARQPDILPTVLELIGVESGELGEIDGRSFRALIDGEPWTPEPAFVSVSGTPADLEIRGVRTESYKYTFGPENDELPQELYDLRDDPGETRNIAASNLSLCNELRELANSFLPKAGESPLDQMELSAEDQVRIEKHLQELGYIE
jgi:arylsulfatase A-like enzyme